MRERNYFGVIEKNKDTGSPNNGMFNVVKGPIGLGSYFILKKNVGRNSFWCLAVMESKEFFSILFWYGD